MGCLIVFYLCMGIDEMWDALQFEFMRNALLAGVLVSISCGIIGTLVVVNRIVFISGGIAHAAYGGIGLALEGHLWEANRNWGYVQYKNPEEATDAYLDMIEILKSLIPRGYSAAVYTQITDVEIEVNGLLINTAFPISRAGWASSKTFRVSACST